LIREVGQLCFERGLRTLDKASTQFAQPYGALARTMLEYAFAGFKTQIEPVERPIALLEFVHYAQALQVVLEAAGIRRELAHAGVQRILAGVAERRVAKVMGQRNRFDEVFVQAQRARQRAGDLRHFETVGEARAKQIAFMVDENLGLVLEPPKGTGVDDAIAVTLELGTACRWRLCVAAPAAQPGICC